MALRCQRTLHFGFMAAGTETCFVNASGCLVASGSALVFADAVAGEIEQVEDLAAEVQEFRSAAVAGALEGDIDDALDPAGARRHDDDAVAHVDCLVDV